MHKNAKTTKGILHVGHEFQLYNRVQRNRMVNIRGTCVTVPIYKRNSALNMRRNIIRRKMTSVVQKNSLELLYIKDVLN